MYKLAAIAAVCGSSMLACAGGHGPPSGEGEEGPQQGTAAARARSPRAGASSREQNPEERRVVGNGAAESSAAGSNTNWRPGDPPPRETPLGPLPPVPPGTDPEDDPEDPEYESPGLAPLGAGAPASGAQVTTPASESSGPEQP